MNILLMTVSMLVSCSALAAAPDDLVQYFANEITAVESAVSTSPKTSGNALEFQQFGLGISASVKFGIDPGISLTVSPELDFTFAPGPQKD